jgi:two-component system chemotaxis response regulator CheB
VAGDGDRIERGRIVVAPPTRHLLIRDGHLALTRGPRENRHRPAIDPLFRSAARVYRERVVGIVLSGGSDDGSAGLFTIKSRGGITIVQDPEEAQSPWMPANALREAKIDHCLTIPKIAQLLVKLAGRGKGRELQMPQPSNGRHPKKNKEREVPFSCPECHGPMFEVKEGKLLYFHCEVGHAFAPGALTEAHTEALERALWIAMRTLRERISIQQRLMQREEARSRKHVVERLGGSVEQAARDLALLQEIIERL